MFGIHVSNLEVQIIRAFIDENAFLVGKNDQFKLSSGKSSDYYLNLKSILANTYYLSVICELMHRRVKRYSIYAGMELGAIKPTSAFGMYRQLQYGYQSTVLDVRKQSKGHGTETQIEGYDFKLVGLDALIIEDVTTTGGSVVKTANILRQMEINPVQVLSIIDRKEGAKEALVIEGIELISLLDIDQLRNKYLESTKY